TFDVSRIPEGIAYDGANIWVANQAHATVTKLRASDGVVLGVYPVGFEPGDVLFDGTSIWVTTSPLFNVYLTKLDPSDGSLLGRVSVDHPRAMAFDGTKVWVTNQFDNTVTAVPYNGGVRHTAPVGNQPVGIAFDGCHIWVVNVSDNSVSILSASNG